MFWTKGYSTTQVLPSLPSSALHVFFCVFSESTHLLTLTSRTHVAHVLEALSVVVVEADARVVQPVATLVAAAQEATRIR